MENITLPFSDSLSDAWSIEQANRMEGNVKALETYSTRNIEIAQNIMRDMSKCNSTTNVVDKLQKVLDARTEWTVWEYKDKDMIVICPTHRDLNGLFTQEEKYNLSCIGKITLHHIQKNTKHIGGY